MVLLPDFRDRKEFRVPAAPPHGLRRRLPAPLRGRGVSLPRRDRVVRAVLLRLLVALGCAPGFRPTSVPAAPDPGDGAPPPAIERTTDGPGDPTTGPATCLGLGAPEIHTVGRRTIVRRPVLLHGVPVHGAFEVLVTSPRSAVERTVGPRLAAPFPAPPAAALPGDRWGDLARILRAEGIHTSGWTTDGRAPTLAWILDGDRVARLCLGHRVHLSDTGGEWIVWLEASTGAEARRTSLRRFGEFSGQVLARIPEENLPFAPTRPLVEAPLAALSVVPGGQPPLQTEADGTFALVVPGTSLLVTAGLAGPWIDVQNQADPDATFLGTLVSGVFATIVFGTAGDEASIAEANAYQVISRSRTWVLELAPGFVPAMVPVVVHVNVPAFCSASYLPVFGTIQLTASGSGCANAAYGTILAHEYYHHLHAQLGIVAEEEVEEAHADIFAAFVLDDPRIGADYHGPGIPIRDLGPDVVYPVPIAPPAERGLPLSGGFWDLRSILANELGPAGTHEAAELWMTWVLAGSGTLDPGLLAELIALDDDDGDPTNGTPHFDALVAAFGPHGFDLPLFPVEDLTCVPEEGFVRLAWTLPDLPSHDTLAIERDGVWMGFVGTTATEFVDQSAAAGPHSYRVLARRGTAEAPSDPCTTEVPVLLPFRRGDVNADDFLDVSDGIQVLGYLFAGGAGGGPAPTCLDALDADDSGVVDIADALRILLHLFDGAPPPPPPFPETGSDPTPDALLCL